MNVRTVNQARSFRSNPRHYPRKLLVNLYNLFSQRQPQKPLPSAPESILIQAPEKVGDTVLLMPLLKTLSDMFPTIKMEIISSRKSSYLFSRLPFVSAVHIYRSPKYKLKKHLAGRHFNMFYNPKDHPSITAFILARMVNADVKVCLAHEKHKQHYNYSLPNRGSGHVIEKNGELLRAYGVSFPLKNFFPFISEKPDHPRHAVALNISSGDKNRIWPLDNWLKLIQDLLSTDDKLIFYLFAMDPEKNMAESMLKKFKENIKYPLSSHDLFEAGSIIQKCRLLISPDTALVHVAAAAGLPVVGIYSGDKKNREKYIPYGVESEIINAPGLTIKEISSDEVKNAFYTLIKRI